MPLILSPSVDGASPLIGAFDIAVLGAGSAGCAVAARLSENPGFRVILIEAGGDGRQNLPVQRPGLLRDAAGQPSRLGLSHRPQVNGLWVEDSSVMPRIASAITNAACMTIGERAMELIPPIFEERNGSCQTDSAMSPKAADPQVREALVETAARLLAHEGPAALSTRRLATELGTSTMAVYTHFGSMEGLHQAVRKEAFARLVGHLDPVTPTDDPVADLAALGWAYCFNALANPQLYRAVFLEPQIDSDAEIYTAAATQQARDTVARCIDAGRFTPADPESLAIQTWVGAHGMVTAALAQLLTIEQVATIFPEMGIHLFVGFGDERRRAERSIQLAQVRMEGKAPL